MDLSQALAQVQIHQSCFHKHPAEVKRSEERTGGLMERQTLDNCTACEVSETAREGRCSRALIPWTAALQLGTAQRNGDRKYLIYI